MFGITCTKFKCYCHFGNFRQTQNKFEKGWNKGWAYSWRNFLVLEVDFLCEFMLPSSNKIKHVFHLLSDACVGGQQIKEVCARSRCQGQVQLNLITSHSISGIQLLFPAHDICFWHTSPQVRLEVPYIFRIWFSPHAVLTDNIFKCANYVIQNCISQLAFWALALRLVKWVNVCWLDCNTMQQIPYQFITWWQIIIRYMRVTSPEIMSVYSCCESPAHFLSVTDRVSRNHDQWMR